MEALKSSWCQKMRHVECQRTVPFTDDDSGRRSAGSGDGRYAVVRTENPLCDQCHSEYVTDIHETRALLAKQVASSCQMAGLCGNDRRWRDTFVGNGPERHWQVL